MLDTVYVVREARLDTSSQLQSSNPLILQWAHHLPNPHLSREWKSPFLTSAYPLATKIAFLPWLHGTPVPSWRLLLSAGVERPQDILARNESVVAEDSAQVQRWFHLRQVMLDQSYPARRSAMSFSFSPPQLAPALSCLNAKADGLDCWVSIHFLIELPSGEVV